MRAGKLALEGPGPACRTYRSRPGSLRTTAILDGIRNTDEKLVEMWKQSLFTRLLFSMMAFFLRVFLFICSIGILIPGIAAQQLKHNSGRAAAQQPPILATEAASRYVGGPNFGVGAIQVDAAGNIYAAGSQWEKTDGGIVSHAMLYKLNPQFEQVFSLPIAGNGNDLINAMAQDPDGNIYLTGTTTSTDFPLMNPIQAQNNGSSDLFLIKLDSEGSLLFSTYFGGSSGDAPNILTVDADGNAFIGGQTASSDFPSTPGAYISQFDPPSGGLVAEPFVVKIETGSSKLEYSTALGVGEMRGQLLGVVEVGGGDAFCLLELQAGDFPVTDGSTSSHFRQPVLVRLSADGTNVPYASYAPTAVDPSFNSLLLNRDGNPLLVGSRSVVTMNPATNMIVSTVHGTFAPNTVMDANGNLVGTAHGNLLPDVTTTYAYPSGSSFIVDSSSTDGSLVFATALPNGTAGGHVAVGPGGAIYSAGGSGAVLRIFPDRSDPSQSLPRMLGIANAAGSARTTTPSSWAWRARATPCSSPSRRASGPTTASPASPSATS